MHIILLRKSCQPDVVGRKATSLLRRPFAKGHRRGIYIYIYIYGIWYIYIYIYIYTHVHIHTVMKGGGV